MYVSTIIVAVHDAYGNSYHFRARLDCVSQPYLITSKIFNELGFKFTAVNMTICGKTRVTH